MGSVKRRVAYAYGLLRQPRQGDRWSAATIAAPFSNDKPGVQQLAERCAECQLDPIHLFDVLHDFMGAETGTLSNDAAVKNRL